MMWLYAFLPTILSFTGAAWTAWRRPKPEMIGAIQHFAAGVIFYAAAGEILPDATHKGAVWTIVLGGALGIVTMLAIRRFAEGSKGRPTSLIAASTIDALIDGLVLGLGFSGDFARNRALDRVSVSRPVHCGRFRRAKQPRSASRPGYLSLSRSAC